MAGMSRSAEGQRRGRCSTQGRSACLCRYRDLVTSVISRVDEPRSLAGGGERSVHHLLRLPDDRIEVSLVLKAFRVNLVDGLSARRPSRKPAALGDDFEAIYRSIVAGRAAELG